MLVIIHLDLQCRTMSAFGSCAKLFTYGQRGDDFKDGAMVPSTPLLEKIAGWSAVYLLVLLYVGLHLRWWSSLETSPLAGTAEPPNLELSEVKDPDGEAVPHMEDLPEAPRQPTAESSNVGHGDPERTVSGSNSRVDMLTDNKNAHFVVAAILGNVVSVALFDVLVLITEIIDHEHGRALTMGKSRDGSVQWHWEIATTRGDHILKHFF